MTILALDTTSEWGSIAIRRDGETLTEVSLSAGDGFAHMIFGELEKLGSFRNVDCFAAASGPGAFTGVRVGLSVIKGLAEAFGKPAVGVSNLRALGSFGKRPLRSPILDARRGEVYAALYDQNGRLVIPERVTKRGDWLAKLPHDVELIEGARPLAAAIAAIAEHEAWLDPAALDANYVRRSDAELFWADGKK